MVSTIETAKKKYTTKVKTAQETKKQCKRVARFLGVSEDEVCRSAPAKAYMEFDVDTAWETLIANYKAAWTTPA